jgi:Helix-turn-helix domain
MAELQPDAPNDNATEPDSSASGLPEGTYDWIRAFATIDGVTLARWEVIRKWKREHAQPPRGDAPDTIITEGADTELPLESPVSSRPVWLTREQRIELVDAYQAGTLVKELVARYGVSRETVRRICRRAGSEPRYLRPAKSRDISA